MKWAFSRKNLWQSAPPSVRRAAGSVLALIPTTYLLGGRFQRNCHFLEEVDRWPTSRIRDYQLAQLRQLCTLAVEKSAYYRRVFAKAGVNPRDFTSCEDLRQIPTINRDTIIEHLDDMMVVSRHAPGIDAVSTGGTGGVPLHFYIGANRSAVEYAYLVRAWNRAGYRLDMPLAVFRGRTVQPDARGLRHEYDPLLRHHYYSAFHMTDEAIDAYMRHVATIGNCFIHAYPSSAYAIATALRRIGRPAPGNVRGVLCESEIVYPDQRSVIEEVFGCRCFSSYGQTEKVVAAAACEHSNTYHVWPTYGWFELLDRDGRAVTKRGERGEIVGTSFLNDAVPFIRYRTGDYATWVGDHCSACGRQHPVIEDIRGHRIQESLVAADGSLISWTALNMHDDTFSEVRQFQFRQEAPGRAMLRVVPARDRSRVDPGMIRRSLGRKLDGRLTFDIELVERIDLSSRGKAIYVDQRIPGVASPGGAG